MFLSVENLSYRYPGGERPALDSVSFSLEAGGYIAVLGANGSGKSTLARCVVGLIAPDSGSVSVASGHRVPSVLVFQSPGDQIVAETVSLDVAFGLENLGIPREAMLLRVPLALESFDLASLGDASTHGLSSGGKQRLALAGATVLDPAILVLDEPSSMLSPVARKSLLEYLDSFHRTGGTVIHITHDLEEASRADRILVMDDGRLVFDGDPSGFDSLSATDLARWGLSVDETESRDLARPTVAAPEGADSILECRSLSFGLLRDFSLTFKQGSITAVTGESGSGKTLLMELLAGLRVPESGSIERASGCRASLAVQESEASLFAEFVADDVAFGPRNSGLAGDVLVARVRSAMDMAGLPFDRFADRRTFTLSGGERRKAALAGIIAMDAPVLLLDEPSSALDVRSRGQLLALIRRLKAAGKTVVFTTNRTEECAIADTVITLPSRDAEARAFARPVPAGRTRKGSMTRDQATLERLRSGVQSQDSGVTSPLHRVPPALKYVLALSMVVAALACRGWPWILALIALEFIPVLVARQSPARLALGILKILPWLLFFAVIQYLLQPDLRYPALFILRFVALYIPLSFFSFVTAHTEIMYGMEDILLPLRFIGVPVRDVSLVTGIVFRFIPLLYEEAARITTARIIRGAGQKRGIAATIQSMASLFVPLMLRTLTRAERLAEAITARYYGKGKNSRYLHWKTGISHLILGIAVPALAALLILASFFFGK